MRKPSRPAAQRGVAVITALLLTTLAITIVASLFWQQQVQVRSMENQRLHLQTKWNLRGALEVSTMILRADKNTAKPGNLDTLEDFWAVPLEEVRLDTFLENHTDTEPLDGTIYGHITDANSMYNLSNLIDISGKVVPEEVTAFKRLLANLKLDSSLAQPAADAVAKAGIIGVTSKAQGIRLTQIEDLLSVSGFTPKVVDSLKPFAIFLPQPTAVNIYTASAEVLSARIGGLSLSDAVTLVANRKRWKFTTNNELDDFFARVKPSNQTYLKNQNKLGVNSMFFVISGRARLDRASLNMEALVMRNQKNGKATTEVLWIREN